MIKSNVTGFGISNLLSPDDLHRFVAEIIDIPGEIIIFAVNSNYELIAYNYNFVVYFNSILNKIPNYHLSVIDFLESAHTNYDLKKNVQHALSGNIFSEIGDFIHKDTKYVYKDIFKPVFDKQGKVLGAIAYLTDFTEKNRDKDTWNVLLNISEQVAKSTKLVDLLATLHENLGNLIDVNNFYVALYNPKTETYQFPFMTDELSIIPPDKFIKIQNGLTDYVRTTGKPLIANRKTIEELSAAGIVKQFGSVAKAWLGVPLKSSGNIIGVLAVQSYTDEDCYSEKDLDLLTLISDHIAIAVEKKRSEEVLIQNQKQLQIAQSVAHVGTWEYDFENKQIFATDEAFRIFGFSPHTESLARKQFFEKIHTDDGKAVQKAVLEMLKNGTPLDIEFQILPAPEAVPVAVHLRAEMVKIDYHKPYKIIGMVQDITRRKMVELNLKKAKEKAEEADKLKSAFLANMSHEIRTPMNAILGFSRLLIEDSIEKTQKAEYIEYIIASGNNLLNLIDDIIDVAKIEAGQLKISKSVTDVNKILQELKLSFERQKSTKGKEHIDLRLVKNSLTDLFLISDPFRFRQILNNLIGNALKFTENGYIEFGYEVKAERLILFHVKDTGIGIPGDKLEIIFNRFGRIEDNKIKDPGGTGLGLSISKHLVEELGGKIWVKSTDNGTTFFFTLPDVRAESQLNSEFKSHSINEKIGFQKILVVEDNPINQRLIIDSLERFSDTIEIKIADNGRKAIEIYMEFNFDVIIMDVRMPEMDGYEATKYIREKFQKPKNNIPILGLSAHAMKEEKDKCLQVGMDDYLTKPFVPEELVQKLNDLTRGTARNTRRNTETTVDVNDQDNTTSKALNKNYKFLDITILELTYKGNRKKMSKILEMCVDTIPKQMLEMENSYLANNWRMLRTSAHSLKTTFTYLGQNELKDKFKSIENESLLERKPEALYNETKTAVDRIWNGLNDDIQKFITETNQNSD